MTALYMYSKVHFCTMPSFHFYYPTLFPKHFAAYSLLFRKTNPTG
uniref:Uncharacterized protein n=1 Tax=Anguilla anguilla TaxID=7936 RepID=A0A0E9VD98_ANGAN